MPQRESRTRLHEPGVALGDRECETRRHERAPARGREPRVFTCAQVVARVTMMTARGKRQIGIDALDADAHGAQAT